MYSNEEKRAYQPIGTGRLLDIKVILDDQEIIYEGMVDDAPEEIRKLKYSKVDMQNPIIYYVYSELN